MHRGLKVSQDRSESGPVGGACHVEQANGMVRRVPHPIWFIDRHFDFNERKAS